MELLSSLLFVIILQATVIFVLTIIAFFIRQGIILIVRMIRYRKRKIIYKQYNFDLFQIPENLHSLIPYAKEFGISNIADRHKYQEAVLPEDKLNFVRAVRGKENEIYQWFRSIHPKRTKETIAFAYMLKSISEMRLMVDYIPDAIEVSEIDHTSIPRPIIRRILFYQPRPKNILEKFIYDLFTSLIAIIICPLYYVLVSKIWSVFSPHETSTVAFGIICTLAILLALFTIKTVSWMINRFLVYYPLS